MRMLSIEMQLRNLNFLCSLAVTAGILCACSDPKLSKDTVSPKNDKSPLTSQGNNEGDVALPRRERTEIEAIRTGLAGQRFKSLTLANHRFSNVLLKRVDDEAIHFSHAGGEESIAWDEVDTVVKEKWGYDPVAFMKIRSRNNPEPTSAAPEAAVADSNSKAKQEYYALLAEKEKRKKQLRMERESLYQQAKALREQIAAAEKELNKLLDGKRSLQGDYSAEDQRRSEIESSQFDDDLGNDTIGGVSTSKKDREKSIAIWDRKILEAEDKVDLLNLQLRETEKRLAYVDQEEGTLTPDQ